MLTPVAMDTDYGIDFEAIFEVIASAEVITFRFVTVPQRLLFDARHTQLEGPFLRLVPQAASLEERFKAIKQLRPRFKLPEKITGIWWPRYARSLVDTGVWERVLARIRNTTFPQAADQCDEVLRELIQREQAEILNAITGKGYHTVWASIA